jgi:hypothetical protein
VENVIKVVEIAASEKFIRQKMHNDLINTRQDAVATEIFIDHLSLLKTPSPHPWLG